MHRVYFIKISLSNEKKNLQSKVSICPRNLGKKTRNVPGVFFSQLKK